MCILVFSVNVSHYIYINTYIYIYIYIPSLYVHRTTLQVFRYFTRILLARYIFKIMEKLISRNISQQLFQKFAIACFFINLSTFNNVSQAFHLSNFNNVSQKIFVRSLINSYFCFNLITLQNFVLRT